MRESIVAKCAGVAYSCWAAFKAAPIESIINNLLFIVVGVLGKSLIVYHILAGAVLVDMFTGFVKARRNENISSAEFSRKFINIFVYVVVIAVLRKATYWHPSLEWISVSASGVFFAKETVSIFENLKKAGFEGYIPEFIINELESKFNLEDDE